jgi:hypothetical protein
MRKVRIKWASYILIGVRYEQGPQGQKQVSEVRVTTHGEGKLSLLGMWPRQTLIRQIDLHKFTFVTACPTENGLWRKGIPVTTHRVNGNVYLRTDDLDVAEDDLGDLPEF